MLQSIALGGHHVDELPAARHERVKGLQGRIRQRAWCGMDSFGKERQEMRIQAVGLGELSGGLGEVADLPRLRHHHREARGRQRRDEPGFVSSGGLQNDERRRQRAHAVDRCRDAGEIVRRCPRRATRTARDDDVGLGDVDADEHCGCRYGATPPRNCSGSGTKRRRRPGYRAV